jgi:hypothetical protein
MTIVARLIGASLASWLASALVAGPRTGLEILLGMIAPLVVVCGTWLLVERTYTTAPRRLTSVMITAFAAKMLLFGGYVAFALRVVHVRPAPFVASFVAYFIGLNLTEALLLRRLFGRDLARSH